MSEQGRNWQEEIVDHPVREYITYILSGAITLGLVGFLLGLLLHTPWIVFLGLGLGAAVGAYLAWRHLVDHRRSQQDSTTS